MPKFLIERTFPGAGKLTKQEFNVISKKSCNVLQEMGPPIQWIQSYVTEDKIFCIYLAENADMLKEHARIGEFPIDEIAKIKEVIDPTTADEIF